MQDAPTTLLARPVCAGCGCDLDVPPAIRALVELLGDETLCAACHNPKEEAPCPSSSKSTFGR